MDLIMPILIEEIPAHEVTATSLDLFNHHERVESRFHQVMQQGSLRSAGRFTRHAELRHGGSTWMAG